MPLYIEDDTTTALVAQLAEATGTTELEAVRQAVTSELAKAMPKRPLRERLAELHALHPLPEPTGRVADKAFFDE